MNATKLLANRKPALNAYQLACGYLQTRDIGHMRITLWHESAHYHVRATYHTHPSKTGWTEWDNAITRLTEARKSFARMVRTCKGNLNEA